VKRLVAVALLAFLTFPAGCLRAPVRPVALTPGLETQLLDTVTEQAAARRSLKGMVRMTILRGEESTSITQALLLEKPDRLRSDVLGPFGSTLLQASSDGRELALYLPRERRFLRGPATPRNLLALTRVPLPARELVDLLLYSVPLLDGEVRDLRVTDLPGYVLDLVIEDFRQQLDFDADHRLVASRWYRDDVLLLQVDYAAFDASDGFPRDVAIDLPAAETALQVRYTDPRLDGPIRAELFRLTPPADVNVEPFPGDDVPGPSPLPGPENPS